MKFDLTGRKPVVHILMAITAAMLECGRSPQEIREGIAEFNRMFEEDKPKQGMQA